MKLTIERLGFGYPSKPVDREVSLSLHSGEVLYLLGPNGSGKTTLFNTMLGLLLPQAGVVYIDGRNIAGWPHRGGWRVPWDMFLRRTTPTSRSRYSRLC